uniref:Sirohydrochlorin cobaltochelatase,Sirohydrochlorin cobaltochelatase,Sirohydrochlorin cobaltochelatase n=1 Tax=Methanocaldococcus jannaschii (strain ATCC 43067 / DSM 2661 / JAL-1 / JCM 10045 / NBRC 100440) TaxID=243232 RepID=UPI0018FE02A9|nr:Chain A, Sirohydrochlorin cobaltochelatase,Sirohydrochlorin cobaltochelatase,Sirohydrochlorin cobaltochelatase [synthetic construct]6M2A_B Chain B, Sirohydrochlorin cobaltochelatase,Sirohydrochlorin cobaltochelatase,Sirohydrochlorin cobaltochelatase [synthetic construct]
MEALVLVGHGSRLPYSKELLVKLAEKVKERNLFPIVEIGLMEFSEPTIPQAVKKAIEQGAKRIIVVPVFLAHGIHTTRDIPRLLGLDENGCGTLEIDGKTVEIIYREPIGADDRIVDIIIDRAFGR